jgi:HD-GYP domain-containing protein (c-di-GMP phosphodiesterase class II)
MGQVTSTDVQVGRPLPFNAFDKNGKLLLKKGTVIKSQKQLDALLSRGLFSRDNEQEDLPEVEPDRPDPFDMMNKILYAWDRIVQSVGSGAENFETRVLQLCATIQKLCDLDSDAALGAIHLRHEGSYSINRSIQNTIFCELIARQLKRSQEQRVTLLAASLCSNVTFIGFQNELNGQKKRLNVEQRQRVEQHPQEAVNFLESIGVEDQIWLQSVLQHHEMLDGSGYPSQLRGKEIIPPARIIALSDRYGAAISPRAYRRARVSKDIMRNLLVNKGKQYDATLCMLFIKELGVFPPGSLVTLKNGETAVITRRGKNSMKPECASVLNAQGGLMGVRHRNSGVPEYEIQSMCFLEETAFLSLNELWGYK